MSCRPSEGDRTRPSPRLPPSPNNERPSGARNRDGALVTVLTAHRVEARLVALSAIRRLARWFIIPAMAVVIGPAVVGGALASHHNAGLHPLTATVVSPISLDTGEASAAVRLDTAARVGDVPVPVTAGFGDRLRVWVDSAGTPTRPEDVSRDAAAAGFLGLTMVLAGVGLGYSCWWPHRQDRLATQLAARDEARWQEIVTELKAAGVGKPA